MNLEKFTGAHPRSRGDHPPGLIWRLVWTGSSPLARGPPTSIAPLIPSQRLIPARAGTTYPSSGRRATPGAHPRSRGDHGGNGWYGGQWGSSPLARGPRADRLPRAGLRGLIPARAGTTYPVAEEDRAYGAHPRSRGDHTPASNAGTNDVGSSPLARGPRRHSAVPSSSQGSSPLARGPLLKSGKTSQYAGLIPARAGTTLPKMPGFTSSWAHPRSRGDHG